MSIQKVISKTFTVSTVDEAVSIVAQYTQTVVDGSATTAIHDTWVDGDLYMRMRSTDSLTWSAWQRIVGENGAETDYSFNISTSTTSSSATTAPSDCYYTDWQDAPVAPTSAYPYLWMKIQKKDGSGNNVGSASYVRVTGEQGATGNGIASVTEYYARNNSTTAPADSSFDTAVLNPTASQKYVWNYEVITYTNGSTTRTDKHIVATYGTDGVGISSITEYYAVNNSSTSAPADGDFSTTVTPPTATYKYLWNYEVVTYTDGTTEQTSKRVIGTYGEKGDDAVVYSITTDNSSVTIAAGEASATYSGKFTARQRIGSENATAYSCYIQVWRKKGSTYTLWATSPNKTNNLTVTMNNVTTASYDSIVATMSDTVLASYAGYLAEVEVPVYKVGDNGTNGKIGRFYYYAGDWESPDQQIHWVQTMKELADTTIGRSSNGTFVRQADGSVVVTTTTSNTSGIYISTAQSGITEGHKYLFATCVQNPIPLRIKLTNSTLAVYPADDTKHVLTGISTAVGSTTNLGHYGNGTAGSFTIYYIRCIDLTAIYGAGNEPTTVDAFEADYRVWMGMDSTDAIDYSAMLKTDEVIDVFGNSYVVSDQGAPWFSYNSNNYVFVPDENGTYTRTQMGTPRVAEGSDWKLMWDDMKYLITEAIFASFAKFGSAIISGDWMISTNGTIGGVDYADGAMATVDGVTQPAYMFFDPDYPDTDNGGENFIPYRSEDLRTGSSYLMDAHVRGTVDAQILKTTVRLCRHYTGGNLTAAPIMPYRNTQGVKIYDWYPEDQVELWNNEDTWFASTQINTTSVLWLPSVLILVSDPRVSATGSESHGTNINDYAVLPHPQRFIGHEIEVIVPYSYYANQINLTASYYVAAQSAEEAHMIDAFGNPVYSIVLNEYPSGSDNRPTAASAPCRVRLVSVNMAVYGSTSEAFWMVLETENARIVQ